MHELYTVINIVPKASTRVPFNFNAKLKRESFTVAELEKIAEAVDAKFERNFILSNGDKVKGDE